MVFDFLNRKKQALEEERLKKRHASILDLAILQRSKVYIKFPKDATNITGVTANIMAMDPDSLVLELSGINALKDRFIGQPVECFFKIIEADGKHREFFYNFTASILRVRQQSETLPQVVVSFPHALQGTQRRKSLRMKPDIGQFSHLALWRYDAGGGFDISKPTINLQNFKHNLAFLENISAGGLRLRVRRQIFKEQAFEPAKGERFILFVTFSEALPKLRSQFWLICKINNLQVDPVSGDTTLGMEFVANGVQNAESGKVEWSKIADNIIDEIAQRMYLWHLSLYREKGMS